jgi:hypothetical protein
MRSGSKQRRHARRSFSDLVQRCRLHIGAATDSSLLLQA